MGVSKSNIFSNDNKVDTSNVPVFGIDLGTTNSAISVVRAGNYSETIKLSSGKMTMPSCVMWRDGEFIVGDEAYAHKNELNVVYSIKRHMEDDSYAVTLDDNGNKITMTPIEVSAEILKGLVEKTEGKYGEVKDVIVTVPAYFSQVGRDNTKEACIKAGLNPINVINEPTAASMLYDVQQDTTALFYDLGGGTFDVTLASIKCSDVSDLDDIYGIESDSSSERVITVIDTNGDTKLGGDDIDNELVSIFADKMKKQYGTDFFTTPKQFQNTVRAELIRIKNSLHSQEDLNKIFRNTSSYIDDEGNEVSVQIDITAEDLANALRPIFKKTIKMVDVVIRDNNVKPSTLVLVGGSTKHPILREWLAEAYPNIKVNSGFEPDLSVSGGAAVFGKTVKFGTGDAHVFDIIPQSIGVASIEGNNVIIPRKSPLPAYGEKLFTTSRDNQDAIDIQIIQGDSVKSEACTNLGILHIDGIKPQPAGTVAIKVKLNVDITNTLHVFASVNDIERELTLDLKGSKNSKDSRIEARIDKWLEMAADISDSKYDEIYELCQMYRNGEIKANVIVEKLNE